MPAPWFRRIFCCLALAACCAPPDGQAQELSTADKTYLDNQRQKIQRFLAVQNFARAANLAERVVERLPENAQAWMLVVECHLSPAWVKRNDSRCEEAAERLIELGGRTPRNLRALAIAKFRQRRSDAVELIGELVDGSSPMLGGEPAAELLVMRARLLIERADPQSVSLARADLDRALTLKPEHSTALIERSSLLLDDGEAGKALRDLERVILRRPGDRQVHFLLSRCYRATRDMTKARHHREVSSLINRLVDSMATTSAPDLEERFAVLSSLRELNPKDGQRRMELVDLLLARKDIDRAETELGAMQSDFPGWAALRGLEARVAQARKGSDGGDGDGATTQSEAKREGDGGGS